VLCLTFGAVLGGDAPPEQARAAVAGIAPAFEINQKRLPGEASPGLRVADDLSNWGMVVGEQVRPPASLNDLTVTLSCDGHEIASVASAGHIDDHYTSLAALARRLAQFGLSLEPGQRVITGAFARTPFAIGRYRGDFGAEVGCVEVELVS
jgi:2-keto-4-pentenoate hydratase